jgi:hypothetical protein
MLKYLISSHIFSDRATEAIRSQHARHLMWLDPTDVENCRALKFCCLLRGLQFGPQIRITALKLTQGSGSAANPHSRNSSPWAKPLCVRVPRAVEVG